MPQRSLIWPVTVLVGFATLAVLLLAGALPTPLVAQVDDCASVYPTPGADRDNCNRTATAKVSQGGYPSPSATTGSSQPPPQATATISATATLSVTATATQPPATATVGPTSTAISTRQPAGSPTPTPTSTLVGLETILCPQGARVEVRGRAEPSAALLAYFNDRPVGGALARPDGSYLILLSIGAERPGIYPVDIRLRDSRALVRALACEVPGVTPTPTPPVVP